MKKAAAKKKTENISPGCGRCGNLKKYHWKDCPARDAHCWKWHIGGHFAKKIEDMNDITERQMETEEESDFALLGEAYPQENDGWNGLIRLNGVNTVFKLDTRAAETTIPSSRFSTQKHGALHSTGISLMLRGDLKDSYILKIKPPNNMFMWLMGCLNPYWAFLQLMPSCYYSISTVHCK